MKKSVLGTRDMRRGAVLIVTVALLAILAILAVSFTRTMSLERGASRASTQKVRARFLAESGVEDAVARLQKLLLERPYLGWTDGVVYTPGPGVPLESARQVSFQSKDAKGNLQSTMGYPYSGSVEPPQGEEENYAPNGLHYALQVADLGSLIHIGRFEAQPGMGAALLANNLGEYLKRTGVFALVDQRLGDILQAGQGTGGYPDMDTVRAVLERTYSGPAFDKDWETLQSYVTLHGWVDPTTVRPGGNVLVMVSGPDDPRAAHPINVNTAPEAVLYACFARIQAIWTDGSGSVVNHVVSPDAATYLAQFIVQKRRDEGRVIRSHEDFEALLVDAGLGGSGGNRALSRRDAMVIMVMANPNGRLTRFNPDARLRYLSSEAGSKFGFTKKDNRNDEFRIYADKGRLVRWSTEVDFDGAGRFRIVSLGRIIAKSGEEIASHKIATIVRLAERVTWTSQKDFEDLFASGRRANVDTYPESMPSGAASTWASAVTGGFRLAARNRLPGSAQLGALRPGDGKAFSPEGHEISTAPFQPMSTGSVLAGQSDRMSDGFLADPTKNRVVAYSGSKMPVGDGTVEFWVKFTEEGIKKSGGLFWTVNDLPERRRTGAADQNEGIDTVAYYQYNPATGQGEIHISRTYFFFNRGVPSGGSVSGYKREIKGKLKSNAHGILIQRGRELFDSLPFYGVPWGGSGDRNTYKNAFAQWYAELILQALQGGRTSDPSDIMITHHVVDQFGAGLAPTCGPDWYGKIDDVIPLIYEEGYRRDDRSWKAEAYHTVVNETDKSIYSSDRFGPSFYDNHAGTYYKGIDSMTGIARWQALKSAYNLTLSKAFEIPYAASRIEVVKTVHDDRSARWRPGEWHHVKFSWRDGTGYMDATFDGQAPDRKDEWGPLNIWSSRMRETRDRVYFGAYVLDRASGDDGNPSGGDLPFAPSATSDRLIILSNRDAGGAPIQDRYYAEARANPQADQGSFARFSLPIRSRLGAKLFDEARAVILDCTSYTPALPDGTKPVQVRVFVSDGRALVQADQAVRRVPEELEVKILFDLANPNPALEHTHRQALDVTPFVDSITAKVLVRPDYMYWSETLGR